MENKNKTTYIGVRISREDYWKIKQALAIRQETMQDSIIQAISQYLKIKISSPTNTSEK